jgi:hypothetical protein
MIDPMALRIAAVAGKLHPVLRYCLISAAALDCDSASRSEAGAGPHLRADNFDSKRRVFAGVSNKPRASRVARGFSLTD